MTPACVALDDAGVEYDVHPYDHDPTAESFGLEAADALGVDPEHVFKTLMATTETGELLVAIVPVARQLDLKAIARAAGVKRVRMAAVANAERSSGYVAGGISPFGQRKRLRTFLDLSANDLELIYVSAGRRGLDLSLDPTELVRLLDADVVEIASAS
jgi:Cys-tRNA(Pro)/Cys-tRNA(Cys) deacylase